MVRAKPGEPANTIRIRDNLKDIQKLYASKGYVTASLKADAIFDDSPGTVIIRLEIKRARNITDGRTGISRARQ